MTILWQLYESDACQVRWGTDTTYGSGTVTTSEYGHDHQHSITLANLVPGTKYFYKIVADTSDFSASFNTAPDDTTANMCFFMFGDTRTHEEVHDLVAQAYRHASDVLTGHRDLLVAIAERLKEEETIDADDFENFFADLPPREKAVLSPQPVAA